jgi:hypothetical protein
VIFFVLFYHLSSVTQQKILLDIIPKNLQVQNISHTTQHTTHNTQKQDELLLPYPQQLCPISPWQHLPWPQIMVLQLPTSLLQAPGSGIALAMAGSLGFGTLN